ncbi:MAG: transcriptional regulator [Bacteroidetes bacterium]|nr:MAG: transcriptional regulator [Bacteroidota bacterium]
MKKKTTRSIDQNAEAKIKEAARKLFTQKGYAAVKTREIAAEAGINLALLNYYFRSKEKLFEIIMMESMQQFMQSISILFLDEKLSVHRKIELLVESYITMLLENPNLPLFILNEIGSNPKKLGEHMDNPTKAMREKFIGQLKSNAGGNKKQQLHYFHIMANMIGLTIFPFAAAPIMQQLMGIDKKEFAVLMTERKKLIPLWMKSMMENS